MRAERDNLGDRDKDQTSPDWAELLETYLESLEGVIRSDLEDLQPRSHLRHMDLTDALTAVATARDELRRCPEGARLALHVVGAGAAPAENDRGPRAYQTPSSQD